jgi:hypothetical protein
MNKILAIGGAVIKTAREELLEVIKTKDIKMLIHNGGSLFHDFQIATDKSLVGTSYPLTKLLEDYSCNKEASKLVWNYLDGKNAPEGSITRYCQDNNIKVLMFTGLACDFWQLYDFRWSIIGRTTYTDFQELTMIMYNPFHYILLGSAVIHPEAFIKAIAVARPKEFKTTVVDFKEMYRPMTRIVPYGKYYQITHKEFLTKWLNGEINV